jgi:hypothetical protein
MRNKLNQFVLNQQNRYQLQSSMQEKGKSNDKMED